MTNYEWIMKSGKMGNFLLDVHIALYENARGKFPLSIEGQYHGLSIEYSENILKKCVEWLQAEHKTKDYVSREDVIDILNNPLKIAIEHKKNMVTLDEVSRAFAEDYKDKLKRVCKLEVKEIDE